MVFIWECGNGDDMVDTTFFFLCLGHRRDLFISPPFIYLGFRRGNTFTGNIKMRISCFFWCNVTAIWWDLPLFYSILLSLDMLVAVYPVTRSTTIDSLLLHTVFHIYLLSREEVRLDGFMCMYASFSRTTSLATTVSIALYCGLSRDLRSRLA